jgi:hypothetical protein
MKTTEVKMNSTYLNIFYVFIVLAVVLLILAIGLFFGFNIPKVIGDLTGKNSQKEISKIREENKKSGIKEYKASKVNAGRGKITDKIANNESPRNSNIMYGDISTVSLENDSASVETTVLSNGENATTVLSENQNDFLPIDEVTENTTVIGVEKNASNEGFVVEEEILFTESNEVIV